jgi:hypothetical protein
MKNWVAEVRTALERMLMGGLFVTVNPHKSRAKRTHTQIAAPNQNKTPSQSNLEPTMRFSVPITGLAAEAVNSVVSFFASIEGQNASGYLDNLAATGMFNTSFICCSTM